MTEKKIFAYKLLLSLNISDFNLLLYEHCNPSSPENSYPLSKLKSCQPPPPLFFENLIRGSTLWGGSHYDYFDYLLSRKLEVQIRPRNFPS